MEQRLSRWRGRSGPQRPGIPVSDLDNGAIVHGTVRFVVKAFGGRTI
jgi:hypothetical protein